MKEESLQGTGSTLSRVVNDAIENCKLYSGNFELNGGMFSWERNQIPNLVDSVRITAFLLEPTNNADVAETEKHRFCKSVHAGANPVVSSFKE